MGGPPLRLLLGRKLRWGAIPYNLLNIHYNLANGVNYTNDMLLKGRVLHINNLIYLRCASS